MSNWQQNWRYLWSNSVSPWAPKIRDWAKRLDKLSELIEVIGLPSHELEAEHARLISNLRTDMDMLQSLIERTPHIINERKSEADD